MPPTYFVYILASADRRLYVGVTGNLSRRVWQHRELVPGSYTARHRITRLVYFKTTPNIRAAIRREKEIKRWRRAGRLALIESVNPEWRDLLEIPARAALRPPSGPAGPPG